MKKIAILLLVGIDFLPAEVFCQTNVSAGIVIGSWQKSNSPYKIQGNIYVPKDSTLKIEPGVVVEFQGEQLLLQKFVNHFQSYWHELVKTGSVFDLKSRSRKNLTNKFLLFDVYWQPIESYADVVIGDFSICNGQLWTNVDYGNYSYGYWGKLFGLDKETLVIAASLAQYISSGHFAPPRDSHFIKRGYTGK